MRSLSRYAAWCAALSTFVPAAALACGGLFCSVPPDPLVPSPPAPVDQTAENIIFEVNDDDTITAHVQIAYTGSADDFAWIVPVPDVPDVAESDDAWFAALEGATRPVVFLPLPDPCPQPNGSSGRRSGVGCGGEDSASSAPVYGSDDPESSELVSVLASASTENYSYEVVQAAEATDLIGWLADNGYNVSDNMAPAMQPYLDGGMVYLAVRLREGRSADNIVPIAMTYPGDAPMIPLQLTAVAAQPLMGVQVWIFGDTAFHPANYADVTVDTTQLAYDADGRTNYFAWVARATAEADGHLFVTQAILGTDSFGGLGLDDLIDGHEVVSRFYTRMNPEHMNLDPMFEAGAADTRVFPSIDMSGNASIQDCNTIVAERLPSQCAFHYCGAGATCYETDSGTVGCDCPDGQVASRVTAPDGSRSMTCVPADNPLGITAEAGGVGGEFDPCADADCGSGTCVLRSGFPTCLCDDGAVAATTADGGVYCLPTDGTLEAFGPGGGAESVRASASTARAPLTQERDWRHAAAPVVPPMMVMLGLLALRRRAT